jgi:hypothetical protein
MKTLLTILLLTVFTNLASAQSSIEQMNADYIAKYGDKFGYSIYTYSADIHSVQLAMYFLKDLIVGFEMGVNLNKGNGEDYSGIMGPNAFPEDIFKTVDGIDYTFHMIVATPIHERIVVGVMLGAASYSTAHYAYDRNQILSYDGYYYTTSNGRGKWSLGLTSNQVLHTVKGIDIVSNVSWTGTNGLVFGAGIQF